MGDKSFCCHHMLGWCNHQDVSYVVDLAKNHPISGLFMNWKGLLTQDTKEKIHEENTSRN